MSVIRSGAVKWKDVPTDLEGPELRVGDRAPADFVLVGADLSALSGADLAGKPRILCAVPSLDTAVCDLEMRRFNTEAEKIPGVKVVSVSLDLPFALKRWCGSTGSDRIQAASDWKERAFGRAYGVFAPAKALLARAVFVIGADDTVRHVEYVADVVKEPDYDAALAAARALA